MNDGFVAPDWNAPLDVEAAVALCPETATIKGFMSQALVDAAAAEKLTLPSARASYLPFNDYSLREHMHLLVESAHGRFPTVPLRIGLRRFGRAVRHVMLTTPYGRVAFGRPLNPVETLQALARSYKVVLGDDVEVVSVDETARTADVDYRAIHHFIDSVHVGVVEGHFGAQQLTATVLVHQRAPHHATFRVSW